MNTLGEKLKKLRKDKRWTIKEVAKKLDLKGYSTYSNWEYDLREPDLETIARIADLYEVDPTYLMPVKIDGVERKNITSEYMRKLFRVMDDEERKQLIQIVVEDAKLQGNDVKDLLGNLFLGDGLNINKSISKFHLKYNTLDARKKKMIDDMIEMLGNDE